MYSWAIAAKNVRDVYVILDENPELHFEYEDLFVDVVVSFMKALNISELRVCNLCRDGVIDDDIDDDIDTDTDDIISPQELESMRSELRQYFADRYETCIQKYPHKYSYSMKQLYFKIENEQKLNVEQIIDALKLKLRSNICFFTLQCDSKLYIDFGDDCLFIRSDCDCKQVIEKIEQEELLEVFPLREEEYPYL